MPFVSLLRSLKTQGAGPSDPWANALARSKGSRGPDGVERITTRALYDILGIPEGERSSAAGRRLATVMRTLGWVQVKFRDSTRDGYKREVRGYARRGERAA